MLALRRGRGIEDKYRLLKSAFFSRFMLRRRSGTMLPQAPPRQRIPAAAAIMYKPATIVVAPLDQERATSGACRSTQAKVVADRKATAAHPRRKGLHHYHRHHAQVQTQQHGRLAAKGQAQRSMASARTAAKQRATPHGGNQNGGRRPTRSERGAGGEHHHQ